MGTNSDIPGSSHKRNFAAFSRAMKNWGENPFTSDVMNNTIECEFDGRKVTILWGKYVYLYPRSLAQDGFC